MKNFLTVLLASSISVSAAYATKIKGKVLDGQTGEAIAGATVFLEQVGYRPKHNWMVRLNSKDYLQVWIRSISSIWLTPN